MPSTASASRIRTIVDVGQRIEPRVIFAIASDELVAFNLEKRFAILKQQTRTTEHAEHSEKDVHEDIKYVHEHNHIRAKLCEWCDLH